MRICMLASNHDLKDDRIYWKETISLKKEGHEVVIVVMGNDEKSGVTNEGIKYKIIRKRESKFKNRVIKKIVNVLINNRKNYKRMLDVCRKIDANVYHFHDLDLNYVGVKLKKENKGKKVVYDVHEFYPDLIRDYYSHGGIRKIFRNIYAAYKDRWELKCSKRYDYILTADDETFKRFSNMGIKVGVVYNFSEFVEDCKLNNKSKLNDKEFDGIYCGSITKVRGAIKILNMLKIAKGEKNDIKFLFLGPISEQGLEGYMKNYIIENDLQENIILKGNVPHSEVPKYLLKSKIGFVTLLPISKYYKNIPIKQFEYMSYGLPIIGSNLPPIAKFINESKSGILVDPNNPNHMWKAMKKILYNDELYEKYSNNGVNAIKQKYNWKNAEIVLLRSYEYLEEM